MAVKQLAIEVTLEAKKAYAELSAFERKLDNLVKQRIKLNADVTEFIKARDELSKVENELSRLNQKKIELGVKMTWLDALDAKIRELKDKILDFKDEKIIIETKLYGQKEALRKIQEIYKSTEKSYNAMIKSGATPSDLDTKRLKTFKKDFEMARKVVEGTKSELNDCNTSIKSMTAYSNNLTNTFNKQKPVINEYKNTLKEIERLNKQKANLELRLQNGEKVSKQLAEVDAQLAELSKEGATIRVEADEAQKAQDIVMKLAASIDQLKAKASRNIAIGTGISKIGDAMLHPIKALGNNGNNWFGKISYMLTKGIAYSSLYRMTAGAMNTVNEGLTTGVERYDVNKAGQRTLRNMGIEAALVDKEVTQLGQDLKGLPTSLNEGMSGLTQLTAVMGNNVTKARELFNAVNDGILANGGTTENTNRAIRQLSQSMGKGKIDAQSFNSLLDNQMAPALVQVGKMFKMNAGQLKEAVGKGTITVDQFTDALIKLDKQGNGTFKSLHEMALEANGGIRTSVTNAKNAVARGVEGILKATDAALASTKYKGIGNIISMIGSGAEDVLSGISGYITSHKDEIVGFVDKVATSLGNFIDKVKSFDYKSFFSGLQNSISPWIEGLKSIKELAGNVIGGIVDKMGGDPEAMGRFVGNWLKAGIAIKMAGKELKAVGKLQSVYAKVLDARSRKMLNQKMTGGGLSLPFASKIKGLFNRKKVGTTTVASKVGSATNDLAQTSATVRQFDLEGFKTSMSRLLQIGLAAGDIWLFAEAIKNVGSIDLGNSLQGKLLSVAAAMAGMYGITTAMTKINEVAGVNTLASFATLGELALGAVDIKLFAEALKEVDDKIPQSFTDVQKKLASLAVAATEVGAFAGVVGMLMVQFPILAAGEIVGLTALTAVAGELILWAQAMKEFDEKCPSDIRDVQDKLNTMDTVMMSIGGMNILNSLTAITDTLGAFDTLMKSASLSNLIGMAKKLEELDDIDVSYDNVSKVERIADLMEAVSSDRLLTSLGNAFSAWGDASKYSQGETMFTSLSKIGKAIASFDTFDFDTTKAADKAQKILDVVRKIAGTQFPDIGDKFTPDNVDKAVTAMNELGKMGPAMKTLGDVLSADNAQIDIGTLQNVLDSLKEALEMFAGEDFVSTIGTMPSETETNEVLNVLGMLPKIADSLNGLKAIGVDKDAVSNTITNMRIALEEMTRAGNLDSGTSSFAMNVKRLSESAEIYDGAVKGIDKLKEIATSLANFAATKVKSGDVMTAAKELKAAVDAITGENSIADAFSDFSDAGLEQGVAAMDKVQNIVDKMTAFAGAAIDSGKLTALRDQIQKFLDEVAGLQTNDAEARTTAIAAVVEDFKGLVEQLQGLQTSFTEVGSGWANALIEAWNGVKVSDALLETISAALKSLKDKEAEFESRGKAYGTKLVSGFNSSITGTNGLAAKLGTAAQNLASGQNIEMFRAAGETLGSALVNSYNAQVSKANTPRMTSKNPVTAATGAVASVADYLNGLRNRTAKKASGGIIPTTMTDTVPAMLTPGEFVIRKDAVRHGGKRLLKQINAGDLIGAYRNLQHRFTSTDTMNRVTNVSNITNNTTTTKTINIQGDSNDRGLELKAGRFMRALG